MPIFVTFEWQCELCENRISITRQTSVYMDEMADDRDVPGWTSEYPVPEKYRKHSLEDIAIACPQCREYPDWEKKYANNS